jgi:R3H domain
VDSSSIMSSGGRGRGRGRGRHLFGMAPGMRPVTEDTRISLEAQVEAFQASGEESKTFPATLTNDDRAVVHNLCRRYGMKSRSHGCGLLSDAAMTLASIPFIRNLGALTALCLIFVLACVRDVGSS